MASWPSLNRLDHVFFLALLRLAFHHHDVLLGGGDDEVHVGVLQLRAGRVDHELAVDAANAHFRDDFLDRNVAHSERSRCSKASQRIRHYFRVGRNEGNDHLHFAEIIFREQRAQGAVDEAGDQDFGVGDAAFALEE